MEWNKDLSSTTNDFANLTPILDPLSHYYIVELPANYKLYKGMRRTKWTTADPLNVWAQKPAWFSTKEVADIYAAQLRGMAKDNKTYCFTTLKPLRLLVLLNHENLDRLFAEGAKLELDLTPLHATLGWGWTWEHQLKFIQNWRLVNRPELPPLLALDPPDPPLKLTTHLKIGPEATHFRRVSISTDLDREMALLICKITKLDGYIAYPTPIHFIDPRFEKTSDITHEEILICRQPHHVEIIPEGSSAFAALPDFIGYQGAIYIDQEARVVNKLLVNPTSHLIEREKVMAALSRKIPGCLPYEYTYDEAHNSHILQSPLCDMSLERYLQLNLETLTSKFMRHLIDQVKLTLNRHLRNERVFHGDPSLANWFINLKPGPTLFLGDFGTSIQITHEYLDPYNQSDAAGYARKGWQEYHDWCFFLLCLTIFATMHYKQAPEALKPYVHPELKQLHENSSHEAYQIYPAFWNFVMLNKYKNFYQRQTLLNHAQGELYWLWTHPKP